MSPGLCLPRYFEEKCLNELSRIPFFILHRTKGRGCERFETDVDYRIGGDRESGHQVMGESLFNNLNLHET